MTEVLDRLVVNTRLGMMDTCSDRRLCGEILAVSRGTAEEYFLEEEREAIMAECWMQ